MHRTHKPSDALMHGLAPHSRCPLLSCPQLTLLPLYCPAVQLYGLPPVHPTTPTNGTTPPTNGTIPQLSPQLPLPSPSPKQPQPQPSPKQPQPQPSPKQPQPQPQEPTKPTVKDCSKLDLAQASGW